MRLSVVVLLSCFSFALYAGEEAERQAIQLRIQPVGKVFVQNKGQSDNKTADTAVKMEPGQDIYERYCSVCHRDGLAGAPKYRNEQDWKPHLAGKKLDDLLASALKGVNAMPAKGTCIQCSDDELKAAISYMLPKS